MTSAGARMEPLQTLLADIAARRTTVAVIGLGYAGLPLALRFAEVGFAVIGIDHDRERVALLEDGRSGLAHIDDQRVAAVAATGSGRFRATTEVARVADAGAVLLCLPTPLDERREPDLSAVLDIARAIAPHLRAGQLVALESTTWPGTTEEALLPRLLEANELRVGESLFVVFSPEREDPGNPRYGAANTPRICGGVTPRCLEAGVALYQTVVEEVVPVSGTRTAEMAKLLENTYRSVNIALVNELKMLSDRMGLDIFEIVRAAATKPFGFIPFYPGPGTGGHCIPVDPLYLAFKARQYEVPMRMVELADQVHNALPGYVAARTAGALEQAGKTLAGARVLVLGVAYKKNIDDIRESPGLRILAQLQQAGARVSYTDPYVPMVTLPHDAAAVLHSVPADDATVRACDCVVIATDHDAFDWEAIGKTASLIVDCRGVFTPRQGRVVRA